MLKIVYFFNWICAGALALFVLLLLLEGKKVGDAATRGLGSTLLSLCVAALAILVVLNLLPRPWTKYAGSVLVLIPLAFVMLTLAWPQWTAHQREARARAQAAQPIFADANLERLARVIEKGEPAELQTQIASSPPEVVRSQELL